MKRTKDDDKVMGPMFPRLHVNDTGKGGPRAPPRNKMALYEQLSIPSQRFNSGVAPLDPSSNTKSTVAPGSSCQEASQDRNLIFPHPVHPSPSTNLPEKLPERNPGRTSTNTHVEQFEPKNKIGEEDDFTVPVFVRNVIAQNGVDREKHSLYSSTYSGHSNKTHLNRDPQQIKSVGPSSRQEGRIHRGESKILNRGNSVESTSKFSKKFDGREKEANTGNSVEATSKLSGKKTDGHGKEPNTCTSQEHSDHHGANLTRLQNNDSCVQQDSRFDSQPDVAMHCDVINSVLVVEEVTVPQSIGGSQSGYCGSPNIGGEHHGDKTCESLQFGHGDQGDDFSEASMVDSLLSGLGICPDDVVGLIGQKHFWKARKAIANHQRVFAVQVFELHRLIKVQQLMAGSTNLMLESGVYLSKPALKCSPTNKVSSEYVVKLLPHAVKQKDDLEKPNQKIECSAENAVKTSLSSVKNGNHPPSHAPYSGNLPQAPVPADAKMSTWYPQSTGHQWLVPIMSPTEGLIYKPYPGSGYAGAYCGGCGPYGPNPMTGNFMNLAYGIPASHHPHHHPHPHPGVGVLPGMSPVGHGYFPPYGMPVLNPAISSSAVEQMLQFPGPGSHGQASKLSGGGANFNAPYQSSCNTPTQKNGSVTQAVKFQASKNTDLQGSTASSPSEKVQRGGAAPASEARDSLPLFPVAPVVMDGSYQFNDTGQPTRVIKVVPHNPRLATESAARIFRSIQEERKQFDST